MSEYEKILREIGAFGPYQVRVFILVSMFETPLAWAMLLPMLLNGAPDWSCGVDVSNITDVWTNNTVNVTRSHWVNQTSDTCSSDGGVCENITFSKEYTSIVTEFSLICDQSSVPNWITTIQMTGVLFGALLTGQLADLIGRRKVLFLEYSMLLVFWFASAYSPSWQVYAVLRFFIGALIGGTLVVNFVLPLEFVTPEWRTFCGCVGFWAVGLMVLGLWGYLIQRWQTLVMASVISSIFILFTWWFIPESPRWLLSKGRLKEAEEILSAMALFNKKSIPNFTTLQESVELEQRKQTTAKKYSYWHLFTPRKQARASILVMYGWFVASAAYYGLTLSAGKLAGNRYLNIFLSGLVEIPALVFVLVVNNRLGRRKTVSGLMLLGGACCFSILFIDLGGKLKSWSVAVIILAMLGKMGITGGWAAVQVFSAESFPTVIRNIGVGACSVSARIGGIVAPLIMDLGSEHKAVPFTVFGIIAIVCGILILFVPETSGVPLADLVLLKERKNGSTMPTVQYSDICNNADSFVDIGLNRDEVNIHDTDNLDP
ncbi:hypothetical protein ScPMuIL_017513 [Solemya velum]